jgi:hypothetical protein
MESRIQLNASPVKRITKSSATWRPTKTRGQSLAPYPTARSRQLAYCCSFESQGTKRLWATVQGQSGACVRPKSLLMVLWFQRRSLETYRDRPVGSDTWWIARSGETKNES